MRTLRAKVPFAFHRNSAKGARFPGKWLKLKKTVRTDKFGIESLAENAFGRKEQVQKKTKCSLEYLQSCLFLDQFFYLFRLPNDHQNISLPDFFRAGRPHYDVIVALDGYYDNATPFVRFK